MLSGGDCERLFEALVALSKYTFLLKDQRSLHQLMLIHYKGNYVRQASSIAIAARMVNPVWEQRFTVYST